MRHRSPEERYHATLHPLPALLEAIWNLAYYETDRRRRKRRLPKVNVLDVAVWFQGNQARVLHALRRHLKYLKVPRTMGRRTLRRQVAAFRRDRLLNVVQPSPKWNKSLRLWVAQPNVYTVTWLGKLWIKRHVRAITKQLVV